MSRGLYVHFPFCLSKCSYCDFYKELHDPTLEEHFYRALRIETDLVAGSLPENDRELSSIYIGGGTPSLSDLNNLTNFVLHLREVFDIPDRIEFSIEINPESVNRDNLLLYKILGINRPVIGIQSFNPRLLKILGRRHDPTNSHHGIYLANALSYDNYGVDIIYGLPRQTNKMLSADIDQIIDLDPPHISFYELMIEDGTPLAEKTASGDLKIPDTDTVLGMYRGGSQKLAEAGYQRYEVCSFAKPGHECRHNLAYWEGREYLALGPSAHSFVGNQRYNNEPDVREYITSLEKGIRPIHKDSSGVEERIAEAVMLGLRTTRGINGDDFIRRFGSRVEDRINKDQLEIFVKSGHLVSHQGNLRLSDDGLYLADEITRRLLM